MGHKTNIERKNTMQEYADKNTLIAEIKKTAEIFIGEFNPGYKWNQMGDFHNFQLAYLEVGTHQYGCAV
jgi:hypothetical protein